MTHDYFMDAAITASNEMKEMGYDITNEEIEERAIDFNEYLQRFPEYDKEGCTSDADGNVIIHILREGGRWEQKYRDTPTF